MRTASLLLAVALTAAACADLSTDRAGAPAPASPTATVDATSTGDCVALGALMPIDVPSLEVTDLADGTQRITSAEGGYSIVVPGAWLVSGNWDGAGQAAFAQAHMTSYDRRAVATPRPEAGMILPPEVGIRFDIEMWANPWREDPDAYAKRLRIGPDQVAVLPGSFVTLSGQRAYRTTLQDERRFQPANAPLITTRQTRAVWLVPSPRDDRMLVFYATPAESGLMPLVERALSTLQISAPSKAVRPVTHQRSEILAKWLVGPSGPIAGRRAEAKLMTYAEAAVAMQTPHGAVPATPRGLLRIDHDPEDLFWLVAVSGPDLPTGRGSPHSSAPPTAWILYYTAATDGPLASTGTAFSSSGPWPVQFDALPDRCH